MPRWEGFLEEARKFWEVAREYDQPGYTNQAVSNAVHAAIAANDAVCLRHVRARPGGEDHAEAVRALVRALKGTRWEREAPQRGEQLKQVLQQKNASQYHGSPIAPEVARRVLKQAERFVEFATKVVASSKAPPE